MNGNPEERPGISTRDVGNADDNDLVALVQCGDAKACAALVRRHGSAMLACARRFLRNEEDSADSVQEAFVSAFRGIGSFAGDARLGTWLHRIVVNCCLMKLRQQRRSPVILLEDLLPTFDETGHQVKPATPWAQRPEARLEQAEVRAQVRACVDQLPELYRTVVLLRDIEELETDRVAALLGVSREVVKTRLHRGRQALRSLLEPYFKV